MKRIGSLMLTIMLLLPTLRAQDNPQFDNIKQHTMKLCLSAPLLARSLAVGYEYDFHPRFGIAVDLGSNLLDSPDKTAQGIFTQVQGRYYIAKLRNWGCAMPFAAAGFNFVYAWRTFNFFQSNDGWTINSRPYTYRDGRIYPELMFGIRVNTPCGITIENAIGAIFGEYDNGYSPAESLDVRNYIATNFVTRIGWSF